ncbi:hypothetical protein [Octadecabacter sp. B2R22]|uniref:hypothetical protein n=1 Tax=unclassified Octadecabacter TaxID=196158 RepID=UPI00339D6796
MQWSYEVGRTTTALDLVSQGIGVALLPKMALAGVVLGGLAWRAVTNPTVIRPIGLLSRLGVSVATGPHFRVFWHQQPRPILAVRQYGSKILGILGPERTFAS